MDYIEHLKKQQQKLGCESCRFAEINEREIAWCQCLKPLNIKEGKCLTKVPQEKKCKHPHEGLVLNARAMREKGKIMVMAWDCTKCKASVIDRYKRIRREVI